MSITDAATIRPPLVTRQRGSGYSELMVRVKAQGLLRRRPVYYAIRTAIVVTLLAVGVAAFVLIGDSWWQLGTAAYFAIVFTQFGFLGHDAGHRQMFRTRRANELAGLLLGNLGIGLGFGWWVDKHHRHHANPNDEDLDPDVSGESIVFTQRQADRRRGMGRFIARHQGILFFPMLLLEALALHVASVQAFKRPVYRNRGWEITLFVAHFVIYFALVFTVLSPLTAIAFIAVHQGLFGLYLGCSFAPNHKGMPMLTQDDQADFLRKQVLTARNVRGGWFVDVALGGLNYQIEHHLFPSMPSIALQHVQPLVRQHCADQGLPYVETGLYDSYRQAVGHLHTIGRAGN